MLAAAEGADTAMGSGQGTLEREAKLIVCAEAPAALLGRLGRWRGLADYTFASPTHHTMHDHFLDTSERALRRRLLALRIRREAAGAWLTLKGPAALSEHGALERLEIERPWSMRALMEIRTVLAAHGVSLAAPATTAGDAFAALPALGLSVVESYLVERRRYDVLATATPVAELALDMLKIELNGLELRFYEVEIEQKQPAGAAALTRIRAALLARYPQGLRPWRHSKFGVALALRALARAGGLAGIASGDAPPSVYDAIDLCLAGVSGVDTGSG